MLLRVVLSMETLQLAGEGAKNKQERANYKKNSGLYDGFVKPNFKKTSRYLWGTGTEKAMGSKVSPLISALNL